VHKLTLALSSATVELSSEQRLEVCARWLLWGTSDVGLSRSKSSTSSRARAERRAGLQLTRLTPASTRARLHGGVRPKWLHGSSVTYAVAPAAAWPACKIWCHHGMRGGYHCMRVLPKWVQHDPRLTTL